MAYSKLSNAHFKKLNDEFENFMVGKGQQCSVSILVSGKTGVGKSHLVNAFVGEELALEEEQKTACTNSVDPYRTKINGTEVVVWDSAGLQDDSGNDELYLEDMTTKLHQGLDIMLYCIKMDEKRFHKDDKNAIRALTRKFGPDIWKNAVIALTFANYVEDQKGGNLALFRRELDSWRKVIHPFFKEDPELKLDPAACEEIPIVPVGSSWKPGLPTCEDWFSELWIRCYTVMNDSSRINLFRMSMDRFEEFPGCANLRERARGQRGSQPSQATSSALVKPESSQSADDQNRPQPPTIRLDAEQQKTFLDKTFDAFTRYCVEIGVSVASLGSIVVLLINLR